MILLISQNPSDNPENASGGLHDGVADLKMQRIGQKESGQELPNIDNQAQPKRSKPIMVIPDVPLLNRFLALSPEPIIEIDPHDLHYDKSHKHSRQIGHQYINYQTIKPAFTKNKHPAAKGEFDHL